MYVLQNLVSPAITLSSISSCLFSYFYDYFHSSLIEFRNDTAMIVFCFCSDAVPLQPVFTSTNKISEIVIEHASSEDASLFARPLASDSRSPVRPADTSTRNKPSEGNKDTEAEPAETMATMQV